MAAVLEAKKDPGEKFSTQVDEQIAEAKSRIRGHDLTKGGLVLGVMFVVYAAVMLLLDKYVVLPEWVRQLALAGFVSTFAAAAYYLLVRPIRRDINPLYAAVQVEKTIDDAKNSVAGYVEAKEREGVHPTVRTAMGAKAAKAAVNADINRAIDHRSILYIAAVGILFLLTLFVMFFVLGKTQFTSVMSRTFIPFSSDPLATRTQLRIIKPEPADATITAGQGVIIGVEVGGRVPDAESTERVRVMIRHNPAEATYTTVPLEKGESSRDWQVRLPDYLVQNGFWYKVAAGDAETEEHHVTVRSLPLANVAEVEFQYPAYLNRKPQTSKDSRIEAVAGTKVTMTAKANREVKDAKLVIDYPAENTTETVTLPWTKVEGKPDHMRFTFRVSKSGNYRIQFTAANGEKNANPAPDEIRVSPDEAPRVEIVKPEADREHVAANGQLAVDATIGDDYGIDKATLKMRVVEPTPFALPDKPFQGGKSFRRDTDNTWPTSLEYKDSVDFGRLLDNDKKPISLTEGMVIEYWLEAADNRQDETDQGATPNPQIGRSKFRKVVLGPPAMTKNEKEKQDQQRQDRQNTENQNNQAQQKRLDTEERKPDQPQMPPEMNPDNLPPKKEDNQPKKENTPPEPKNNGTDNNPMKKENTEPKSNNTEPMSKGMNDTEPKKMDTGTQPKMNDDMPPPKMNDNNMGMQTAPPPKEPGAQDAKNKADQLAKDIEKVENERQQGGDAKPEQKPDAANEPKQEQKPNPDMMNGMMENQPKPEPKQPEDPTMGGASDTKPQPKPSQDGSAGPKPENKPKAGMNDPTMPEPKGMPPSEDKPQPQPNPMEKSPGSEKAKPEPKKDPAGNPMPMTDPKVDQPQDPSGGGAAKPQKPEQKKDNPGNPMPMSQPNDPIGNGGDSKPSPEEKAGNDKDAPKKPASSKPDPDQKAQKSPGDSKPESKNDMNDPGKPMPKDDAMAGGQSTPKPEPKQPEMGDPMKGTSASEPKPNDAKDPMANKPENKATDKPVPPGTNDNATAKTEPKGGGKREKIDPKDVSETAKDLNNPDPKKQQEARDKLDKQVGEENRKEIEKNAKNLDNPDPNAKAEAQKKIDDIANNAAKEQAKKDPDKKGSGKIDPKDLEKAIKDFASADPKEQKAAKEQFDKLSPEDKKKAEEIAKDLMSKNPEAQKAAQEKLKDLQDKLDQQAKKEADPNKRKLTKEEIEDLVKKANDLNSPDDKTRQQAEQDLDKKLGKEQREKLQAELKNQIGDPEARNEDLKKEFENRFSGGRKSDGEIPKAPGSSPPPNLEETKADLKNRLKSSELQLEKFEDHKEDKAIKDAGWTQEMIDKVINAQRKEVDSLKNQIEDLENGKFPEGPSINASSGTKLDPKAGGATGGNASGLALPPPGYADPAKKFNSGAVKVPGKK